jgi:hypothetical protein
MKKLIHKVLSLIFPFKELDSRPVYCFGDETHLERLFRTNELMDFVIKK